MVAVATIENVARITWPWSRGEQFSSWSVGDPAFAEWLRGEDADSTEAVNASTVMGLAAIRRAVSVLAGTIAGLPLRTYQRHEDGERTRITSVFNDPYPGPDGMTLFEWVETLVVHLALWTNGYLWHQSRDMRTGLVSAYVPIVPDLITKLERVGGYKRFTYRDESGVERTVGTDQITHIPGLSLNALGGHPLLFPARAIFSGAISGDRTTSATMRKGIRLAGLVSPEGDEEVSDAEANAILETLRRKALGRENAGDLLFLNKRLKVDRWTSTNIEAQWFEQRQFWLGEAGRLLGVPSHLMNDTEKQTSWGTGVAEQTLNFARFTLMGYTTRIEQRLSRQLPSDQFVEFDYTGLLQGTPAEEIELLLAQTGKPFLLTEEARKVRNLPPLTPKQKAEMALTGGGERPVVDQETTV